MWNKHTGLTIIGGIVVTAVLGLAIVALILIFAPTTDSATVTLIVTQLGIIVGGLIGIGQIKRNGNGSGSGTDNPPSTEK